MEPQHQWDPAYAAIKKAAEENEEEVKRVAGELLPAIVGLYPEPNMILMAALYSLALGGAKLILEPQVPEE